MKAKKIICTLGPASLNETVIRRLEELGVDLFRLNLSHTDLADLPRFVDLMRTHSKVPVCFDTQGAQLRTATFAKKSAILKQDSEVRLAGESETGDEFTIPLWPGSVLSQLAPGDLIGLDFDTALVQVIQTGETTLARVLSGGRIGTNKAAAIDRPVALAPLTPVDEQAMRIAQELNIDCIALSFANRRSDVELVRVKSGGRIPVIAKIESRAGLSNLDEILEIADGILIDRGDLSREVPLPKLPFIQKEIIQRANRRRVPVYVATNLLESMVVSARPTRAEVNDVMNTLIDGADGLVLAAETAIGKHPVECVSLIRSLIAEYQRQWAAPMPLAGPPSRQLVDEVSTDLVNRIIPSPSKDDLVQLRKLELSETAMMDVRQIGVGTFSPLQGFMNRETLESVLQDYRIPGGGVWTMPVVLQLGSSDPKDFASGQTLALSNKGVVAALMTVDEVFQYDLSTLARKWFGTDDPAHPGVAALNSRTGTFLAGKVDLLEDSWLANRGSFEFTPAQSRQVFEHRGWRKVVGFHTRNVAHRAHEYLQIRAMTKYNCDGVLILPVFGPKKKGDFTGPVVMKSYQTLLRHYEAPGRAVLGSLMTYSRYAGPREAIFTALCHRNFGCSHFIIGRDHTGVGSFYPPDGAARLAEKLGNLGIEPVFFNEVYYCEACGTHREQCAHGADGAARISGTKSREMLSKGELPPSWYMRDEVSRLILDEIRSGMEVFVGG